MSKKLLFLLMIVYTAVFLGTGTLALAQITLTGTIRDFYDTHPDFEDFIAVDPGIVLFNLGPDKKPVYAGQEGNPTTHGQTAFDQWYRDVTGVNLSMPYSITLTEIGSTGIYQYVNNGFFPIDNQLFGNEGRPHNYHFTYEIHTTFTYSGGESFTFNGDDDLWVFLNDRLAIDLGGVHGTLSATVDLDAAAGTLGLVPGNTYDFDLFFAERHTVASTFQIETTIALAPTGPTLDIKPRSCPNPLNIKIFDMDPPQNAMSKKGGVLPVAIVGTAGFDVYEIDVSSILLEGVAPLRRSYEDVTAPAQNGDECDCTTAGPDGTMDLTLKFLKRDIAAAIGPASDGDVVVLTITGQLLDGTPFDASDCVVILSKSPELPSFAGTDEVIFKPVVPNPFNPVTRISYYLPREDFVKLSVHDVTGKLLGRLVSAAQPAGEHVVEWKAKGFSSGVYFCRIEVGNFTETRKLILLK